MVHKGNRIRLGERRGYCGIRADEGYYKDKTKPSIKSGYNSPEVEHFEGRVPQSRAIWGKSPSQLT